VFLACTPWLLPLSSSAGLADGLAIAWLGVFQVGLAYACLTRGVRDLPAVETSLLLLVEPVFSPLWAWLAHGERPGRGALAGGLVILLATVVRSLREGR
jgi:drug/metabolite transporter (DMT)-like permease